MAAVAMPHQHPRRSSISSVDQLFELVDGLDEAQIHSLLEDFNNTVPSNVQVSHGVELFERPNTKSKPTPGRTSSIRRSAFKLPRLFTRTPSKRQSSAPDLRSRPKTAVPSGPKHYRRISRPVLPTLSSGPDLDALLSAYLAPVPPPSTSKTSSPSTKSISTSSTMSFEAEDADMDSLAPLVFGRPQRRPSAMGDIFEVLEF